MNCENCKRFTAIKNVDNLIFLCEVCYDELYIKSGKFWELQKVGDDGFKPVQDFPELAGRTFKLNGELLILRKEDGTQYLVNKDGCNCQAKIDNCRHVRFWKQLNKKPEPQSTAPPDKKDDLETEMFGR